MLWIASVGCFLKSIFSSLFQKTIKEENKQKDCHAGSVLRSTIVLKSDTNIFSSYGYIPKLLAEVHKMMLRDDYFHTAKSFKWNNS